VAYSLHCDQCEALAINGVPCHEQGCPHKSKPWVYNDAEGTCTPGEDDDGNE